jgi:ubiquinone/menaquinone biosynthesis C-methylase UbiE
MAFFIAADAYDRFMGRYSSLLAPQLADFADVHSGQRVLDVGCGPGALTTELVQRLGASAVTAVDPSEPFVVAARERHPGVDVRQAAAEELPFADGEFDAALAQLVVHFMADPVRGLAEMARVTKNSGGVVCACVWDHAGDQSPLSPFWQAVRERKPGADAEANFAGTRGGHLTELFQEAGLREVEETALAVHLEHATFEDWWEPFTLGVGPAGVYFASLDDTEQAELREACRRTLPEPPFTLSARAWTARGEPAS